MVEVTDQDVFIFQAIRSQSKRKKWKKKMIKSQLAFFFSPVTFKGVENQAKTLHITHMKDLGYAYRAFAMWSQKGFLKIASALLAFNHILHCITGTI